MLILKQSTAVDVLIGPFVDLTDGATAETGESPSVKLSKNGQTLASKNDATTPAHDADGYYNCELDATDTNTVGTLVLTVAASANALPVRHEYQVMEEATYDDLFASSATGYPTAAETADAVWDEATSGHTSAGTFGEQLKTDVDAILADTNELQTDNVPGLIAALNDPTAASIADAVWDEARSGHTTSGSFGEGVASVTGNVDGSVGSLATQAKADVNAEVLDVVNVDTFSEPSQGAPPASPTFRQMAHYLYKAWRNRNTVDTTSETHRVYADNATTIDHEASVSDDGTTFDRGEFGSGA